MTDFHSMTLFSHDTSGYIDLGQDLQAGTGLNFPETFGRSIDIIAAISQQGS